VHSRYEVSAGAQHLAVFLAAVAEVPVGWGAKEEAEALIVTSGIPEGPDAVVHTQARGSTAKGIVYGDYHGLPVSRVGRATEHDVACVVEQAAPSAAVAGAVAVPVLRRRTEQGPLPVLGMRGDVRCGLSAHGSNVPAVMDPQAIVRKVLGEAVCAIDSAVLGQTAAMVGLRSDPGPHFGGGDLVHKLLPVILARGRRHGRAQLSRIPQLERADLGVSG